MRKLKVALLGALNEKYEQKSELSTGTKRIQSELCQIQTKYVKHTIQGKVKVYTKSSRLETPYFGGRAMDLLLDPVIGNAVSVGIAPTDT